MASMLALSCWCQELRAFHEQIVRRTENGKAMLKLLQAGYRDTDFQPEDALRMIRLHKTEAQGLASRTQGLALLRRVYPETSAVAALRS